MFGNKAPFGSTTSFASSTFGTGSPFGQSTTAFGANKSLGTGFGTPFGSAPPNNTIFSTSGTSGGSIFGASSSSFGQPGPSGASFGFTPTSSAGTGLFGTNAPQQTGSSLFQSPTNSAFGAPKSTFGGFGSTASTGLFGQTQQPSTLFGQNATAGSGLFGSSGNSFSSAFGVTPSTTSGTTIKFNPVAGTDTMLKNGVTTNINIRHQCITVMKEYETKSLEELRVEDYLANRKGPQQTSIGAFGTSNPSSMFGSNAPTSTTGLFQTQNKSLFGSTFGNNPSASTVFGQTNQQPTTGLFGQKAIGFGTPSTTSSSFTFGNTAGSTLFGSGANTQNKSLFGTTANPTSTSTLFGTTNTLQQSAGFGSLGFNTGFGAQNVTAGGLFGSKTAFGTPATSASTFGFGSNANSTAGTSIFSTKANTGFGTTTPFGNTANNFGVFGTGANPGGSLFSQNKQAIGFGGSGTTGFGTNLNTFGTSGGSLFGANANKSGGLSIGLGLGQNAGSTLGASLNLPMNTTVLGGDQSIAQLTQQQNQTQQQLLALTQSPFGDSPLFRSILQDTGRREEILKPTNPAAQKMVTANAKYKISPHPTAKMKPKSIHSGSNGQVSLFDGLDEDDTLDSTTAFIPRRSIKKLDLKPRSSQEHGVSPPVCNITMDNSLSENGILSNSLNLGKQSVLPLTVPISNPNAKAHNDQSQPEIMPPDTDNAPEPIIGKNYVNHMMKPIGGNVLRNAVDFNDTIANLNVKVNKPVADSNDDSEKENIFQDLSSEGSLENDSENELIEQPPHPAGIILHRPGYYTIPPLEKLGQLVDDDGNCFVENFTVGREGFGNVFFYGITNVKGLNLDEMVHFRRKQVTVYPDDENKPKLGEGLNKKAQITLDGVWPLDKTICKPIKNPERIKAVGFLERLERAANKMGGKFLDYRAETGSWVFEVRHFSKYGLEESDDEEDLPQVGAQDITKINALPPKPLQQVQLNIEQALGKQNDVQMLLQDKTPEHVHINGLDHEIQHSFRGVADDDDEMEDVTQHTFSNDYETEESEMQEPSSHHLAKSLGVSSHRMQAMKASLFHEDDEGMDDMAGDKIPSFSVKRVSMPSQKITSKGSQSKGLPVSSTPTFSPLQNDDPRTPQRNAGLTPFHHAKPVLSTPIPESLSQYAVIPSSKLSPTRSRRIMSTKYSQSLLPLERSLLSNRQQMIADTACFMGRRFRVGWGPHWMLARCCSSQEQSEFSKGFRMGKQIIPGVSSFSERIRPAASFTVIVERINTGPDLSNSQYLENLEQKLEIQLANSRGTVEHGVPLFVPVVGVDAFHQHSQLAARLLDNPALSSSQRIYLKNCLHVWNLCVALWGHVADTESDIVEGENAYAQRMARRKAFSDWLCSTSFQRIKEEIQNNHDDPELLLAIFSHLTGCQISEASKLAHQAGDHRLALLIAQAAGNTDCREIIKKQLQNWNEIKADCFISYSRTKIYALLSSCLVWSSSEILVNTCEGLDWKRALGLHLWFACPPVASIAEALAEYEKSFKGTTILGKYSQPPFPPYLENNSGDSETLRNDDNITAIHDMCYHLLKLYVKRAHRLDRLLAPCTVTADPLDHCLSWLLHQSLQGVGYQHLSEYQVNCLHLNFASQLETLGLWHWAIFIALNILDPDRRYSVVLDILFRHVTFNEDKTKEIFLQEKCLIPDDWICKAKALRAHHENNLPEEAWYLLKARQWNQSHKIILKHIAPEAIINEHYNHLKQYLVELAVPERNACILDWNIGGQVFLDYIRVSEALDGIIKGELDAYELEQLQPEVMSLCSRISNISCETAKERLCQSEMAKKTANLLRAVLTLQNPNAELIPSRLLAPHLQRLPMPEDYALQELRALTHNCLVEMTT